MYVSCTSVGVALEVHLLPCWTPGITVLCVSSVTMRLQGLPGKGEVTSAYASLHLCQQQQGLES